METLAAAEEPLLTEVAGSEKSLRVSSGPGTMTFGFYILHPDDMTTALPLPVLDAHSGNIMLKAGFRAAFFLPGPVHGHAGSLALALQKFWALAPPGALKWQAVGAGVNDWRAVDNATLGKCIKLLDPAACRRRDLTSIDLRGGQDVSDAPDWSISIIGNPVDPEMPDELTLLEFSMPANLEDEEHVESSARHFMSFAAALAFQYAYFSPALLWSPVLEAPALTEARSLAFRFPGFDVSANAASRSFIGQRVRGARWITLLGGSFQEGLGNLAALAAPAGRGLDLVPFKDGVAMRAGRSPALVAGNTDEYSALCLMAQLLQPVTWFEDIGLLRTEFVPEDDEHFLAQWERRLF